MQPPRRDHETLASPGKVTSLVGARRANLIVVANQYQPDPALHTRVLVLDCTGAPLTLWDGWVALSDAPILAAALGASLGECDAMYASPFAYAWATHEGALRLYTTKGIVAVADASGLRLVSDRLVRSIARVEVDLSDDWITRTVRVQSTDGTRIDLAQVTDHAPLLDFTYDAFNLLCDTSWAIALGNALGKALQVPVQRAASLE
jgi:hypothetical protein